MNHNNGMFVKLFGTGTKHCNSRNNMFIFLREREKQAIDGIEPK